MFAPSNAPLAYVFSSTDNGRSGPVERPFLAINNTPVNAQAPLRVYADRLVIENGAGVDADVRALSNLTLLQVSRAEIAPETSRQEPRFTPGLVVHAIDDAPSMRGAHLGQNPVAIIHADGVAMSPGGQGLPSAIGFD